MCVDRLPVKNFAQQTRSWVLVSHSHTLPRCGSHFLVTASQSRKITVTLGETCRHLLVVFPSLVRLLGDDSLKDN